MLRASSEGVITAEILMSNESALHSPLCLSCPLPGSPCVLRASNGGAIKAVAFANVRNDLLAFTDVTGNLHLAHLLPDSTTNVVQVIGMN